MRPRLGKQSRGPDRSYARIPSSRAAGIGSALLIGNDAVQVVNVLGKIWPVGLMIAGVILFWQSLRRGYYVAHLLLKRDSAAPPTTLKRRNADYAQKKLLLTFTSQGVIAGGIPLALKRICWEVKPVRAHTS